LLIKLDDDGANYLDLRNKGCNETKRFPSKFLAKGSFLLKIYFFTSLKIHLYDKRVKLAGTEKRVSSVINASARQSSILNAISPKER